METRIYDFDDERVIQEIKNNNEQEKNDSLKEYIKRINQIKEYENG